jgi:hypothetical protein
MYPHLLYKLEGFSPGFQVQVGVSASCDVGPEKCFFTKMSSEYCVFEFDKKDFCSAAYNDKQVGNALKRKIMFSLFQKN